MTSTSNAAILKYGYVPVSFPRDPAEVNQFAEHIVLGQILEPLVDTDKLGNVIPGLAESWTFENKGLLIKFKIRKDRLFSDGKRVDSGDIKYTLERTLEKKSQSSNFLSVISSIKNPTPDSLEIVLSEPSVAILKALSRDQLGIVPNGWAFDKESIEPIIGTGPYRLIKKDQKWLLEINEKYPGASDVPVKKWQLTFFADADQTIPTNELADYAPGISLGTRNGMQKVAGYSKLREVSQISYAQTSAWWHPHGKHFESKEMKARIMSMVEDLLSQGTKDLGLERATGVIPKGIAGHSAQTNAPANKSKVPNKIEKVRFVLLGAAFDEFFKHTEISKVAKNHGFEIEVIKIPPSKMQEIAISKPDVIFAGWAGGFNDPEGFIALLPTFLVKDFATYIGPDLAEKYKQARHDQNWTARSVLFQEINEGLRTSQLMVPGWKQPFYIVGQPTMISEEATFRYTPRLHVVRNSK